MFRPEKFLKTELFPEFAQLASYYYFVNLITMMKTTWLTEVKFKAAYNALIAIPGTSSCKQGISKARAIKRCKEKKLLPCLMSGVTFHFTFVPQIKIGKQEKYSKHDPLVHWEDHEACWKMQYRGSLGKIFCIQYLIVVC